MPVAGRGGPAAAGVAAEEEDVAFALLHGANAAPEGETATERAMREFRIQKQKAEDK